MLAGQICFIPKLKSINGTLVFDGALMPPCGLLKEPVVLKVEKGRVTHINGGSQAQKFKAWLESFGGPQHV